MDKKEYIKENVLDLLISSIGEATEKKRKEMEFSLSLYANDYTRQFIENGKINMQEKEISKLIDEIVEEYNNL